MCASGLLGDCGNLVKVRLSDGSDGSIGQSVFHRTKSYPMEKKWRHDKQGLIQLGMCASGVLGDCGKVRLSDGPDGSIGQACFPSDRELSDWKTDVTTVVGVGNLTSYGIDQSICSNSKLSLLKSEVSLRFLLMAKFLENVSCFLRLLNFGVVSILGRSFTSLASVFNIVHDVCLR